MANLLTVGRAFGLENIAQLRGLVRGVKTTGAGTAHIKLDHTNVDSFQKMAAELVPEASQTMSVARASFPRSFAQGVENVIDIVAKKFGSGSGKIGISGVSKDAEGIIGHTNMTIAGNRSGIRMVANSKAENTSSSVDVFCRPEVEMGQDALRKLVKGIDYAENNGVSRITANVSDAGKIRHLKADIQAPSSYVDTLSILQNGETFGQTLQKAKALI